MGRISIYQTKKRLDSGLDDFKLLTFKDNKDYMKNLRDYILDVIKEDFEDNMPSSGWSRFEYIYRYSKKTIGAGTYKFTAVDENNPSELNLMNYFVERFEKEFNHDYNKKMYPRIHRRIENYLLGLAYNFAYTYHDQMEQAIEFHNINLKDKRDIEFVKRNLFDWVSSSSGNGSNFSNYYFQMITQEIIKLLKKHELYTKNLSL
tara:strand:- start:679 stop:1290 length:612 start_codon:yes stop_codon:yes gene_type:complete